MNIFKDDNLLGHLFQVVIIGHRNVSLVEFAAGLKLCINVKDN